MTAAAPPHPRANPVLGSALDLRRSQIRTYERVMREHGDVVRLAVGPPGVRFDLYCVFHPDGVKAVLVGSRERYSKGNRFYRQIAQAFGWGLLTSEGELWQRQRRLVQPLFTRKQVAAYAQLMAEEAAAVAEAFDPARFTAERERERHPHAYFPFGGGPRACIGSHFAMLEATIAVALPLQRFQIRSDQERVRLDTQGITLRPEGAVPIRPAAR
jgi:cytochrome P450